MTIATIKVKGEQIAKFLLFKPTDEIELTGELVEEKKYGEDQKWGETIGEKKECEHEWLYWKEGGKECNRCHKKEDHVPDWAKNECEHEWFRFSDEKKRECVHCTLTEPVPKEEKKPKRYRIKKIFVPGAFVKIGGPLNAWEASLINGEDIIELEEIGE